MVKATENLYDKLIGINWTWSQSHDSISIKFLAAIGSRMEIPIPIGSKLRTKKIFNRYERKSIIGNLSMPVSWYLSGYRYS